MLNWLNGKKTYIGGAIIFVAGGLKALNFVDEQTFGILITLGSAITVVGLRSAIGKLLK